MRDGLPGDAGDAAVPVLIVTGLILAGGGYFGYLMLFHRQALDTEPGDPRAF